MFDLSAHYLCFCRLQDQSTSCQNQHLHQNPRERRRSRVYRDGPPRGRGNGQTWDRLRDRALLHDPRLTLQSRCNRPRISRLASRSSQPPGTDHHPGARSLPCRGASSRTQRSHDQTHPAADAHLYRDAQPRERPCIRGHRHAWERGSCARGDRNTHHSAHRCFRWPPRW